MHSSKPPQESRHLILSFAESGQGVKLTGEPFTEFLLVYVPCGNYDHNTKIPQHIEINLENIYLQCRKSWFGPPQVTTSEA